MQVSAVQVQVQRQCGRATGSAVCMLRDEKR